MNPVVNSATNSASNPFAENRLQGCFAKLRAEKRCALVAFLTAGDPDLECSERLFDSLAASSATSSATSSTASSAASSAGGSVDLIEIGMPFSDPVADGETIQRASKRALRQGVTVRSTLALAGRLRAKHASLPIVLMGYVNPIHCLGLAEFARLARANGVDGVILVDLPPEEDAPYIRALRAVGVALIRLATPTSHDARLRSICADGFSEGVEGGFLYVVSVAGTTGRKQAGEAGLQALAQRLRKHTSLPLVAGFGVRSAEQVAMFARYFDGVVVGSVLIEEVAASGSCEEAKERLQKTIANLRQGL